jgi:hypothetical protein
MKTKKTVIAVITATLLVSAMLIVGCMDQIDGISVKDKNNEVTIVDGADYQIPVGKGAVRFKIADDNVRSILPDFNDYVVSGDKVKGMYFDIIFTRTTADGNIGKKIYFPRGVPSDPSDTGDPNAPVFPGYPYDPGTGITLRATKATYTEITALMTLESGDYSYKITAYNNDAGAKPVAGYSGTGLVVSAGSITSTPVVLTVLETPSTANLGTLYGIFSYSITLPGGTYDTKKVEIFEYTEWIANGASATDVSSGIELTAGAAKNGTEDLLVGFYIVKVTVKREHYLTRQYTEVLHIYPGFTSEYTLNVPALVQNEFQVTYNLDGKNVSNASDFASHYVGYGKTETDPGTPSAPGWSFVDWYNGPGGTDGVWSFSTIIKQTTTIYSKWNQNAGFGLTFTAPTVVDMVAPVGDSTILHRNGSSTITITLDTTGLDPSTIVWSINDEIDVLLDIGPEGSSNTDTLIITNSGDFLSLIPDGNDKFTISVSATDGGVTAYSASIDIDVED